MPSWVASSCFGPLSRTASRLPAQTGLLPPAQPAPKDRGRPLPFPQVPLHRQAPASSPPREPAVVSPQMASGGGGGLFPAQSALEKPTQGPGLEWRGLSVLQSSSSSPRKPGPYRPRGQLMSTRRARDPGCSEPKRRCRAASVRERAEDKEAQRHPPAPLGEGRPVLLPKRAGVA